MRGGGGREGGGGRGGGRRGRKPGGGEGKEGEGMIRTWMLGVYRTTHYEQRTTQPNGTKVPRYLQSQETIQLALQAQWMYDSQSKGYSGIGLSYI